MTTWTTIPDASIDPGKPARSIDAKALRDNATYLRELVQGTQAEKVVDAALSTTATTAGRDWVLARSALAAAGAVGTYAFLYSIVTADYDIGATLAGGNLRFCGVSGSSTATGVVSAISATTPSGTWRCMGYSDYIAASEYGVTLWLRIS